MSQEQPSASRGWIVTFAALGINLVLGLLYAWGVISKALQTDWGWSSADASKPFTVATVAFAIMMIFAGRLQDRIGPRFIAMLGGVMLGLGLVASSFTSQPLMMLLTYGLIGGIGIGLGYSATTPPAIKWFPPARKGLIAGIVVSGVGLAAVYVSPLTQYLLGATSIPRTLLLLGIGTIVGVCILSLLLQNPPAGFVPVATGAASMRKAPVARRDLDWHEMLRTPQFWLLWITFVLTAAAGLTIIAHAPKIAQVQASWKWGFVPLVILAIFNTVGRIVSGYLSDRIGRTHTMVLAFLLQAANMVAFRYYNTAGLVVFGSALTGLCYGTIFTLMPAAIADFYGVRNLGVNYGFLFTAFGAAGVLGPMVAAWIYDETKSYNAFYILAAVLLAVGAALAFMTRAPRIDGEGGAEERAAEQAAPALQRT